MKLKFLIVLAVAGMAIAGCGSSKMVMELWIHQQLTVVK
jgi:hypothetical protein